MKTRRIAFCVVVLVLLGNLVFAQSPGGLGQAPFGAYFSNNIESLNIYSGNIMLDTPLFSLPGRDGMSTDLRLTYNAQGWTDGSTQYGTYGYYVGGWKVANPIYTDTWLEPYLIDCDTTWVPFGYHPNAEWGLDVRWADPTGAIHTYTNPTISVQQDANACDPSEFWSFWNQQGGSGWLSPNSTADGSMARVEADGELRIRLQDGRTLITLVRVETRNGTYANHNFSNGLLADTLGRTVTLSTGTTSATANCGTMSSTATYTQYTIADAGGTNRNYQLVWGSYTVHNPIENNSESVTLLKQINLPNSRSYVFEYCHDQGFLTKVTLPSGGYMEYDYYGGNSDHDVTHDYVIARRISADGSTEPEWTYARTTSGSDRIVTVTNPLDQVVEHTFDYNGYETDTAWKNSATANSSKVVETTRDSYGRPTTILTTMDNLKQQQTFSWTGSLVNESTQSDWYTGSTVAALTKTINSYASSHPYVPTQVELQKWNGSAYVTQGKTQFYYDQYSLSSVSGTVPNHHTPLYSPRLNLTTVRHYRDTTNYIEEHLHYDVLGNVVEQVDARGKSTTLSYGDTFNPSSANGYNYAYPTLVTNAEGHETAIVYNYATGLPVSVFDARDMETTFEYDLLNRTKDIYGPGGSHIHYVFDDDPSGDGKLGVTEEVTVETGVVRKVETFLDWLSRPIQVKRHDPGGHVLVDTEYDDNGRVKRVSTPYRSGTPVWTTPTYDALDRSVTVTNPDSTSVSVAYSGNTVTTTDEASVPRRQTFNGLGQLTKVEEPDPDSSGYLETNYSYDVFGPLAQVSQGSQTRTFTHNWLGSRTQEVHPETGTNSYTYDDGGLLLTRTDARGHVATYTYDDIGRPLKIAYTQDGDVTPDVLYTYDQNGFTGLLTTACVGVVTSMSCGGEVTTSTFEYDDAGNLTEENVTFGGVTGTFTTGYTYDDGGRLLTVTYPSGRVVTQSYVKSGSIATDRTNTLTDSPTSATLVSSVTDNAAGAITSRTLAGTGGNIAETRSFNTRNQLTQITAAANSATLIDIGYGYGTSNDGRIRSRTDAVQPEHSAAYTFDEIGRLTAVSGGDSSWGISWTLDRFGNRTAQTPSGLASGRVGQQTMNSWTNNKFSGYEYDEAGNLQDDGPSYFYDAESRLYKINSTDVQYAYDYAGRRIKRQITNSSGTVTTYYLYGLTGLMSEFSTTSGASGAASTDRLQYRVGEQTGTAVMLMDSGGVPRENNRVFPFGEPWLESVGSNNNEKFTTYQHDNDAQSDLDYAMARYYASRSGRFMTPDPGHVGANVGDPQSWNAYAYANNDPINATDPTGLLTEEETCRYDWDTGEYSFACPGYGDPVAEALADWERRLAWTYAMLAADRQVGQGNAGGPGGLTLDQRLDALYQPVLDALRRRPCSSIFQGFDPIRALNDAFYWDHQFRLRDADFGEFGDTAQTTGPFSIIRTQPNGTRVVAGLHGVITFNNNPRGSFMTGTVIENAITFLHEVGHVYNRIPGLSAPTIALDGPGVPNGNQASIDNRDWIRDNCFANR